MSSKGINQTNNEKVDLQSKQAWNTGVGSKTSVISGCGMLITGVVKFSTRNCPGINFRKVGNYVLERLVLNGIRMMASKCQFRTEVRFCF